jgi:hypothetical protein
MKSKYKSRLSAALFSTAAFLFVFGLVHYNPRTKDKKSQMIHERDFDI